MYSHISSLARAGGGSADIPTGSSIESSASARAREAAASARPAMGTVDPKNTDAAMAAIRTTVTTVGRAKIAGFASGVRSSSEHNHADAFQRRKVRRAGARTGSLRPLHTGTALQGVVNTVGGAKDITRAEKGEAPKLPPRGPGGAAPGARIATFDTLETTGAEGKARAEGRARREAAEAKMAAGAAGRHDLGGKPVSAPHSIGGGGGGGSSSARGGGGHASSGGFGAAAPLPPRRPLIQPSTVSNAASGGAHSSGGSHALGGGGKVGGGGAASSAGGPATAAAVAAKRAEFFGASPPAPPASPLSAYPFPLDPQKPSSGRSKRGRQRRARRRRRLRTLRAAPGRDWGVLGASAPRAVGYL